MKDNWIKQMLMDMCETYYPNPLGKEPIAVAEGFNWSTEGSVYMDTNYLYAGYVSFNRPYVLGDNSWFINGYINDSLQKSLSVNFNDGGFDSVRTDQYFGVFNKLDMLSTAAGLSGWIGFTGYRIKIR